MYSSIISQKRFARSGKLKLSAMVFSLFFAFSLSQNAFAQDIVAGSSVIVLKSRAAATPKKAFGNTASKNKKNVPAKTGRAKTVKPVAPVASRTNKPSVTVVRTISGGILNTKEANLPKPNYPAAARMVKAGGAVNVAVVIDEHGDVISAEAVSGHALLRAAAVNAALEAQFEPILFEGKPVKVKGIIVYNFVQ